MKYLLKKPQFFEPITTNVQLVETWQKESKIKMLLMSLLIIDYEIHRHNARLDAAEQRRRNSLLRQESDTDEDMEAAKLDQSLWMKKK